MAEDQYEDHKKDGKIISGQ